ncbi:MAG: cell division protein FtsH [Syntrophaceae bacterium CG2_30_49_12]|nr:MAG: cell division protein FtsH [Syntrophaceae bacterium CG2_30_49_12]PIP05410.1 MAG: cell division protein FtsH [Syntrophobacterales bacterium CG23_combo_of_CG06-09_8_20_14_all_48_27]PJA50454.1 MAG: cell division protein FtsH [Syntrophobacterales bacterium CG_4_9_14_3_um_filter_49_8]PJC73829.1 MAG: cell division protein FtsH [Syntrophobacterales bacterium CG_4_8_14_3_um_filter_49_14]
MNPLQKNIVLWLVISLLFVFLYHLFNQPESARKDIIFSEFVNYAERGEVVEVTIQGDNITGKLRDEKAFKTYVPKDAGIIPLLKEKGVRIAAKPLDDSPWYMTILISWFPMLLLIGVWIFFMRQMQAGGGKAMAFGKSRARLVTDKSKKVTFADVAGIDEAKAELEEIIDFLKDPKKFTRLGGRIPKGVLLVGAPGTGKTLLARAIAGEADVPFLSISGSDFVEMFVGVGASRVRDLFTQGKKSAPCIIFIDEIDAVGRHRGAGLGGGHDEREQTLNQLLVEMDGFESSEGVILVSATNRPDVLDPALLRPGRFDRQVVVPLPDVKGREKILEVHAKITPLADDVDFSVISRGIPGFSGADIENLVNEAALNAARLDKDKVTMVDFEYAKDRVLMGTERRSMVISDEEKRNTAYHESGHALVARLLPGTDPIHKVTIIPRGRALGLTQQLPIDEKHTYPKKYLVNNIAILLGGRAAEELVLDDFTTGAGNDIERATDLARKMVCEWGMSEEMGPLSYGKKEEQIFLGREFATHKDYSEETAGKIDREVTLIVSDCYERAKKLLSDNIDILNRLASELLEKEVLNAQEIDDIIGVKTSNDSKEVGEREVALGRT